MIICSVFCTHASQLIDFWKWINKFRDEIKLHSIIKLTKQNIEIKPIEQKGRKNIVPKTCGTSSIKLHCNFKGNHLSTFNFISTDQLTEKYTKICSAPQNMWGKDNFV